MGDPHLANSEASALDSLKTVIEAFGAFEDEAQAAAPATGALLEELGPEEILQSRQPAPA